jgi:hypothetical protein
MAVAMDLDAPASPEAELCSICLDPVAAVAPRGARSVALLECGHKFHLGPSGALSLSLPPSSRAQLDLLI